MANAKSKKRLNVKSSRMVKFDSNIGKPPNRMSCQRRTFICLKSESKLSENEAGIYVDFEKTEMENT